MPCFCDYRAVFSVNLDSNDFTGNAVSQDFGRTISPRPRKRYCTSVSKYDAERQEQIRVLVLLFFASPDNWSPGKSA
jgi:hypothetical protein